MNKKKNLWFSLTLYVGLVLFCISFGEIHGRFSSERTFSKNTIYWVISESVEEFNALASGQTNRASTICGQRIWTYLDAYDRGLDGGNPPSWFLRKLPDARHIVQVVSNQDRQAILPTTPEEAAVLHKMLGTNQLWFDK